MDVSTFYALFSATCFALLGFWWNLLQANPQWLRDAGTRSATCVCPCPRGPPATSFRGMDVSTFYALFSATCFALLGFWWSLLQANPRWLRDAETRSAVGGVYLAFLLPGLMGLFAQVGQAGSTPFWRISFVIVAAVGLVTTLRALPHSGRSGVDDRLHRIAAVVLYALIALVGLLPEVGKQFSLTGIQVEAILLILLVLVAHGLVWRFMTMEPPTGRHEAMSPPE